MFIVIDWIDGSGKATQTELISEYLKKLWKKVKILDYPRYWEKSAFFVEKYLAWEYWNDLSAKQASIFYALDRFDDYKTHKDELKNYDYIISNRYVSASIIHQTWKIEDKKERQDFIEWLEDLEYNIFWIPKPDITIYLSISPEISNSLVEKRWNKKDIHESDENHMVNAYAVANELIEYKEDWIKIECEKDWNILEREVIRDLILKEII